MSRFEFDTVHNEEGATILVVSQRHRFSQVWRSGYLEFEDVISECGQSNIYAPLPSKLESGIWGYASRYAERVTRGHVTGFGGRSVDIRPDLYDLVFFNIQSIGDVGLIDSIKQWQSLGKITACYIAEAWNDQSLRQPHVIKRLKDFDFLFVGLSCSVQPLAELVNKPCYHLQPTVDTLKFCPYDENGAEAPRPIDVYSIGRRSEETHKALLELQKEKEDFFYIYDTVRGLGGASVINPNEHRELFVRLAKRAKYFLAYKAKVDLSSQTTGANELGGRFHEGAAAGTILLGELPVSEVVDGLFGWDDSCIRLPFGSTEIAKVIRALEEDPVRCEAVRKRNVKNMLMSHDWAHRWKDVLKVCQVQAPRGLTSRLNRLSQLASNL